MAEGISSGELVQQATGELHGQPADSVGATVSVTVEASSNGGTDAVVGADEPATKDAAGKSEKLNAASNPNRFSDSFTQPPVGLVEGVTGSEEDKVDGKADEITVVTSNEKSVDEEDSEKEKLLRESDEKKSQDGTLRKSGEKTKNSWEEFAPSATAKPSSKAGGRPRVRSRGDSMTGDAGFGDDAVNAHWTALDDSVEPSGRDASSPEKDMPFRRFKSERVEKHRAARIIEGLNTRRLSNTSLDLESSRTNAADKEVTQSALGPLNAGQGWDIFLKMDRKVSGTRTKWLPVNVTIRDEQIVIRQSTAPEIASGKLEDNELVKEIYLRHNNIVTKPKLKSYQRHTKIHQIKLQVATHMEKRTLKRFMFVEHVTHRSTMLKLGSPDLSQLEELSENLNEAIRRLPITRQAGVAYRMNEVFIDVKDCSDILMNCNGAVLDRSSTNKIYVQAFLTGQPECKLIVNDLEAILRQGQGSLNASTARQVRMTNSVLHPCVDENAFKTTREVRFHPVDGSPFELLRCTIDPYVSPPVNVCALMEFNEFQNHVSITASFIVRKKLNLRMRPIKDLVIKFPIPASWTSLFLTEGRFGRQRSVRSTSSLRGSFRHKVRTSECQIEVHLGNARYEPEHNAILWRIGHYTRSSQPHTFSCQVNLKPGMHRPDPSTEYAEVTYNMPGSSTGLAVRAFKVHSQVPEKWVKYEILYHYRVQMFQDLSID